MTHESGAEGNPDPTLLHVLDGYLGDQLALPISYVDAKSGVWVDVRAHLGRMQDPVLGQVQTMVMAGPHEQGTVIKVTASRADQLLQTVIVGEESAIDMMTQEQVSPERLYGLMSIVRDSEYPEEGVHALDQTIQDNPDRSVSDFYHDPRTFFPFPDVK